MKKDTDTLCAVAFVLDYLKNGPSKIDDLYQAAKKLYGFTRWDVAEAGRHLCLQGETIDGAHYVYRPHNLVAIWWAKPTETHRWTHAAADGGNAA
jgi:hypothetical protein